jgi:hypothetical protein
MNGCGTQGCRGLAEDGSFSLSVHPLVSTQVVSTLCPLCTVKHGCTGIYLKALLLGLYGNSVFTFLRNCHTVTTGAAIFYIPPRTAQELKFLYIVANTWSFHFLFLAVVEVELRVLHLLGRHSTTWAILLALFALVIYFWDKALLYAQGSLNSDPLTCTFLNSWDLGMHPRTQPSVEMLNSTQHSLTPSRTW